MLKIFIVIIFLVVVIVLYLAEKIKQSDINYQRYVEERENRLGKIPLNERKCSTCSYAKNIKKYKKGSQEYIGVNCTYDDIEQINGFYVRRTGGRKICVGKRACRMSRV